LTLASHLMLYRFRDAQPASLVCVSYNVFVQCFAEGGTVPMPIGAFDAVFGPHVETPEADVGFWRLRLPDGGEADVYANLAGPCLESVMINHFSVGVLDLVLEFARSAGAVVLAPGCPILVTDRTHVAHLPEELQKDAVLVGSGSEVDAIFRTI
jgi:hypothetical protein